MNSQPASGRVAPLGAIGCAILLRALFLWAGWQGFFAGDEPGYLRFGDIWSTQGTYAGPWPPGLPWLISLAEQAFGLESGARVLRVFQVLASGWIAHWLWVLGRRLASERAGVAAAWIYALHLPLVPSSHLLVAEQLHVAVLLPALALLLRAKNAAPGWGACGLFALAGSLFAIAGLFRESLILMLPWLAWWLVRGMGVGRGLVGCGYLASGLLLTSAPWAARNLDVLGAWTPFGASSGGFIAAGWNGYYADFDAQDVRATTANRPFSGLRAALLAGPPEPWKAPRTSAHAVRTEESKRRAMGFAAAQPGWMLRTRVLYLAKAWTPLSDMVRYLRTRAYGGVLRSRGWVRALGGLALLQSAGILLLGLWGWRTALDRDGTALVGAALWSYVVLCLVMAMSRYRIPLETLLCVPAGAALMGGGTGRRNRGAWLLVGWLVAAWLLELPLVLASIDDLAGAA